MVAISHHESEKGLSSKRSARQPAATKSTRKYILIDDDANFRQMFEAVAQNRGIQIESFESLMELGYVSRLVEYDGAIIDYQLEKMNGLEIATYLDCLLAGLPAILISGQNYLESPPDGWPKSIKCFVTKSAGIHTILDALDKLPKHPKPS